MDIGHYGVAIVSTCFLGFATTMTGLSRITSKAQTRWVENTPPCQFAHQELEVAQLRCEAKMESLQEFRDCREFAPLSVDFKNAVQACNRLKQEVEAERDDYQNNADIAFPFAALFGAIAVWCGGFLGFAIIYTDLN